MYNVEIITVGVIYMELRYKSMTEDEYDDIRKLLHEDVKASEEFLWALESEPHTLKVVYLGDTIVGVAEIISGERASFLSVFVAPQYRHEGIGKAVAEFYEDKLEKEAQKIITNFHADNEDSKSFARKLGYQRQFSSAYMKYTEGKFNISDVPVRLYTDEDYSKAHALYAQAFHEMRVRVGDFPNSTVEQPSEKNRQAWNEDAPNCFTYEQNGEIAGYGHLEGNEIGSVSVRTDLQGKGIGRKFVKYLCNEIYDRGYKEVILWCVVGNYARRLYESLGFKEMYVAEFDCKLLHK